MTWGNVPKFETDLKTILPQADILLRPRSAVGICEFGLSVCRTLRLRHGCAAAMRLRLIQELCTHESTPTDVLEAMIRHLLREHTKELCAHAFNLSDAVIGQEM